MFKKIVLGTVAALFLAIVPAHAATLNFVGTGQTHVVTGNDIDPAFNTELQIITGDQKTYGNGLFLDLDDSEAVVTYTYMGYEAGNRNFAATVDGGLFINNGYGASDVGEQVSSYQNSSGLLQFAFGTVAPFSAVGVFINNALAYPASPDFAMGFSRIDADSFYVLFDDIATGDRDFDDLVMRIDVTAVPLPAGILLMLTALLAMVALRRQPKTA